MADSLGHDASNKTIEKFQVFNLSIGVGSNNTTGIIVLDCPADKLIITCNNDFSFGIAIDKNSGNYFRIISHPTSIECRIKKYIYWKVLNDDAFEVSICVIRN